MKLLCNCRGNVRHCSLTPIHGKDIVYVSGKCKIYKDISAMREAADVGKELIASFVLRKSI
jgi:hypothetical protein